MARGEIFKRGLDERHEQLLAERGGRIAQCFFRIRNKVGLATADERMREDLIEYHECRRQDPKGVRWDDELDASETERDSWRVIGS